MSEREGDVANRRAEYERGGLDEAEAGEDPLALFDRWYREAVADAEAQGAPVYAPSVMTLATATPDAEPSARIVLLKEYDAGGFVFYTGYTSRKADEHEANPRAELVLHWLNLERQVRIHGAVERVPEEMSRDYHAQRPRGSQLAAWISPQSEVATRETLERRFAELERRFEGREVPRPEDWGGYRIRPQSLEFWQGRPNRLHDRIRFVRATGGWRRERLSP